MHTLNQKPTATASALYAELGANTSDRACCELPVTGTLPRELRGVLYRNGPGLFRRHGHHKGSVLDGDGVMQRLALDGGRAHYTRRFVRTPKLEAEEAAGRFLWKTWTTRAPGLRRNPGQNIPSQAGVTTYLINGRLYALDEVAPAFEIDPQSLATRGAARVGLPAADDGLKAHVRYLADSGDWLFLSTRMGPGGMSIAIVRHRRDGRRVATPSVRAPRMVYLHDFVVAGRHAVVFLQPAFLRPLRFLSGLWTFAQALQWRPDAGTVVLAIDLDSGATTSFDAPAAWVWHIANACVRGGQIVVDFVGYDDPGHFLGRDAQLTAIMRGHDGVHGAPGTLRRYILDLNTGQLAHSVLLDGNFEFPSVDWRHVGGAHRRVFMTRGPQAGALHSGIAAFDTETGALDAFDFGAHVNAGEPVFAPAPDEETDAGWLITQILDTRRGASAFAVFDARQVRAGPVAQVQLNEALPISFHGHWIGH